MDISILVEICLKMCQYYRIAMMITTNSISNLVELQQIYQKNVSELIFLYVPFFIYLIIILNVNVIFVMSILNVLPPEFFFRYSLRMIFLCIENILLHLAEISYFQQLWTTQRIYYFLSWKVRTAKKGNKKNRTNILNNIVI